jgi:hypothetical protein
MSSTAETSFSDENQRSLVKFLFLQGKHGNQIHRELVKVLRREAFSYSHVHRLVGKFKEGDFDVTDRRGGDFTSGAETQTRIDAISEAFERSRAWTLRSLSAECDIPRSTCFNIVTKTLKMTKKSKKWVPHELNPSQLEMRVEYCRSNLRNYHQQKPRLEHTVATDETWIGLNVPPEKGQAREWLKQGESSTSMALPNRFGPKVMVVMAMDINGICYYEILGRQEKMDGPRYLEFLKRLMDRCSGDRKHPVWLLDDNARPHRTSQITAWLDENKICRWLQPAYSPDLSPCDFMCFRPLKRAINGVAYATVGDLKVALDREIAHGNAEGKFLAVQRLPDRWQRCMDNKGEYL